LEIVSAASASDSNDKSVSVDCSPGKKLLGGGAMTSMANVYVYASYPTDDDTWVASAGEDGMQNGSWTVTAYAICATIL
jgi:hypothetical protein